MEHFDWSEQDAAAAAELQRQADQAQEEVDVKTACVKVIHTHTRADKRMLIFSPPVATLHRETLGVLALTTAGSHSTKKRKAYSPRRREWTSICGLCAVPPGWAKAWRRQTEVQTSQPENGGKKTKKNNF